MKYLEPRTILLRGARLIVPEGIVEKLLLVEGDQIARIDDEDKDVSAELVLDLDGLTLLPGFVDAHIHGSVGVDTMSATGEDLHRVARFLASEGVTAWLPTLVPSATDDYRAAVKAIESLMREQEARPAAARVVGVHYEGPFVNQQQCGALRTAYFRTYARTSDLDDLPMLGISAATHMTTVAPEIEGGVELVTELVRRGWVVSIGHTRAGVDVLERVRLAGARHMTHFLNAMSPLHHRAPGPVGWGLMRDDVTVDLIADGVHIDPLVLRLVLRCKTPERIALISDAVAPAGLGDGEYRIWGEPISVRAGRTSNERGSIAGSVITIAEAARMMSSLGVGEADVARMASFNPARLVGLDEVCGSIEEGKRADLVALDDMGKVRLTIVGGRVAFQNLSSARVNANR